jgi:hypothetical protein
MPRKVFTAGEVLAAADVNTYLMNQAIMTFAGTAARGSAIGTATEGMVTYLADSDSFEFFDGSSFVPFATEGPTVEYLVIAGGGGGSLRDAVGAAGGGGAGGYRTNVSGALSGGSSVAELPMPLVAGTYTITVGAGGAGTPTDNTQGGVGSSSIFANIVCVGGGWGVTFGRLTYDLLAGSGGGGSLGSTRGDPVPQQGFRGGIGNASFQGGAGGGGAGATGVTVTSSPGTAGGAGLASSITGSAVTRAGGGGGGGTGGSGGAGGAGGGGAGSIDNQTAGSGTVNTGGGGGGGETGTSGAGGSGIVIFSVPTATTVTFTGGVTQTNSTIGDRQVYVVTATSTTSETVTFA